MQSTPNLGRVYMLGHYQCRVVVHHFDEALVRSWLPAGLELMAQSIAPAGRHPVNLLFGVQQRVALNVTKAVRGFDYMEFALVVPFTRWKEPRHAYNGPFLFTPLIFVDKDIVATGGDIAYGFPKRVASFNVTPASYSVAAPEVNLDFARATFTSRGTSPDTAGRQTLTRLLQQPSVSRKGRGWLGSGFWWNMASATVTNLQANGELIRYLLPGCPDGSHPFVGDGTSDFSSGAAYELVTDWTLTLPGSVSKDWSPWNHSGI